ncbi:MAG: hypothetical protein FWH06_00460 [Oscillospiraceae bacterium]|nr:hypothetical protein [Oscillospiraceae bacterium]
MKKLIPLLLLALLTACGGDARPGGASTPAPGVETPYPFIYKGHTIAVGQKAAPSIEALGEPRDLFESPSCAFDGVDRIYYYSGFELYTWPEGDEDYIASLSLTDDSVSTSSGVCLGMTLEDVISAYGEDYENAQGMYIYRTGKASLSFLVADGEVAAIMYGYDNIG